MSNQRAGNWKPAAMSDSGERVNYKTVVDFMQTAANELDREGYEDASFYFQQVVDHLKDNPRKGFNEKVTTVLGL